MSAEKKKKVYAKVLDQTCHLTDDYCEPSLTEAIKYYTTLNRCRGTAILVPSIATTATICAGKACVRVIDDHQRKICDANF